MRFALVAATAAIALGLFPGVTLAANGLASVPVQGGDGGLECSCMNLTDKTIVIDMRPQASGGGSVTCPNVSVGPGKVKTCGVGATALAWACTIVRSDGKGTSAKQLACSLSVLDAAGTATVVVPVDKKLKQ